MHAGFLHVDRGNNMKFNDDFASIHAYLCADGYVIRNPETQKHKYYYIGLRNTNLKILKDFQFKFNRTFGIMPIITKEKDRCKIQNKKIFFQLTKHFSFYSHEWTLPKLDKQELRSWLKSYFDCDGWVEFKKSKNHRIIGLESVNLKGLEQIKFTLLKNFEINSNIRPRKGRNIWRLTICGKDDLEKFKNEINFFHPNKRRKLLGALNSYQK